MDDNTAIPIAIDQLRIGMYIQLGLNWMSHPFPVSSFRIASESQIEILRGLGLAEVRYVPAKSDPAPSIGSLEKAATIPEAQPEHNGAAVASLAVEPEDSALRLRLQLLDQHRRLDACDQRFMAATRNYRKLVEKVEGGPTLARLESEALVTDCVQELLENTESVISLLSEGGPSSFRVEFD